MNHIKTQNPQLISTIKICRSTFSNNFLQASTYLYTKIKYYHYISLVSTQDVPEANTVPDAKATGRRFRSTRLLGRTESTRSMELIQSILQGSSNGNKRINLDQKAAIFLLMTQIEKNVIVRGNKKRG